MTTTLLGVDLAGRPVLVAGGGPVAALKASALVRDGALVHVVAPQLCEDLRDLWATGEGLRWSEREVTGHDVHGTWFVVAATDDAQVNASLCARATEQRIFSVCAGSAEDGTARNPAVVDHGGMRVGVVSTGRPDPGRVVRTRNALAVHLQTGDLDLRTAPSRPRNGRVVLVGGGPGAADLITVRGRRALAEADVVVTDRLGPTALLDHLPADVQVVDVGKTPGHHPVSQDEINRILVEQAGLGRTVVRLKGGDPYVYGRGGEEQAHCAGHGIPVEVVPGVSSAIAGPGAAGIPLTHRGTVAGVHIVQGHGSLDNVAIGSVVEGVATLVLLMGVSSLAGHVADLLEAGAEESVPVAIVEDATLPSQRVTRAPLVQIVEAASAVGVRAPAVVVIGAVADPLLFVPGGGR